MYRSILINKRTTVNGPMALFLLVLVACSPQGEEEMPRQTVETRPVSYPTASVLSLHPEYEIAVPAELKPYEQVAVYAKVTGFVKTLYADRGDYVRKGQLLAELEAPEMEQRHLSDKSHEQQTYNDYLHAKQVYERLLDASQTIGAVADIELDRARSAMESTRSAYEASKAGAAHSSEIKQYLRITAPFDGVVAQRNVSVGALAGSGSPAPLFIMAQSDKLRLTLSLPEKHASSVYEKMPATFTLSSQPGKIFDATLSRTSSLLDEQDRSLTLEFDVSNPTGELRGGEYAQAKLKLKRKSPSLWVSGKSILQTQSGTYVLTLNDNEIRRIPVNEGIRLDTLTEVFGNLSLSDNVIIKPTEEIKEGNILN